jgi:hypothetical protein
MNTKYINKTGIALVAFLVFLSGCSKQLEINPRQSIDANGALSSRDAINASIISIYASLKGARMYGRDLIALPEALSDNGFSTNKSGRLVPESQNVLNAHFTGTLWSNSFAAINQINNTIEAINAGGISPAATPTEVNVWLGQLYFLRGLYYFDLAMVYAYIPGAVVSAQDRGGVPLTTKGIATSVDALAFKPSRAPQAEVYAQVVSDLTAANSRLAYPGLGFGFANKAAAQGLLARVNLYTKNYTDAKRWADSVINLAGSKLTTTANFVSNWRQSVHGETLFNVVYAIQAENIGVNESLQTSFTTLVTLGNQAVTGGFGDLVPTISLLNELGIALNGGNTTTNFGLTHVVATRNTDVRNLLFEPGTNGRGPIKVECTKYLGKNGLINLDNVPVIRIAEAYLIRAEAAATAGSPVFNLADAQADLKKIKSSRYTDYGVASEIADNALSATNLYEEIIRQRRIEFAFEGHRFFDLKRLGRDLVKTPHYNNVAFTDIRILPAIPQGEVDGNPNLKQNAGY